MKGTITYRLRKADERLQRACNRYSDNPTERNHKLALNAESEYSAILAELETLKVA